MIFVIYLNKIFNTFTDKLNSDSQLTSSSFSLDPSNNFTNKTQNLKDSIKDLFNILIEIKEILSEIREKIFKPKNQTQNFTNFYKELQEGWNSFTSLKNELICKYLSNDQSSFISDKRWKNFEFASLFFQRSLVDLKDSFCDQAEDGLIILYVKIAEMLSKNNNLLGYWPEFINKEKLKYFINRKANELRTFSSELACLSLELLKFINENEEFYQKRCVYDSLLELINQLRVNLNGIQRIIDIFSGYVIEN
ncbi:hypothetical protein TUBRATIS_000400 [Tubulinosema ratisbonensis]|uniref:Uncharacterized protein n=1 Tax=Tubulinosema ratisbonensis TaxID=291195 RepID=A0A437AQM5_9MICR|nr:hypothetical protein TUBRATIS_000400 [Tubulinosema ratisbonensis]